MIQEVLKHLISKSVKSLGLAVIEIHGQSHFEEIESLRLQMKKCRGQEAAIVENALVKAYKTLKEKPEEDLRLIAKSFSLMLELINACETAFRSHRLAKYQVPQTVAPEAIIYVFTSHPTESRSAHYLTLMTQVEKLLIEALESDFIVIENRLLHLMRIAVRIDIANNKRPQVKDEMEQVFQTVLAPEILGEQIALAQNGVVISFRTWVGGDKDGHPKVGAVTMVQSLQESRTRLLAFIHLKLHAFELELSLLHDSKTIHQKLVKIKSILKSLKRIAASDGKHIARIRKEFDIFLTETESFHLASPLMIEIKTLLWLYPALVLPLEIREDSGMIHKAVNHPSEPIAMMLRKLKEISRGYEPKWYVRGFIISMCMTSEDYLAAVKVTEKNLGNLGIPIVPLFENEKGLIDSINILTEAMKKHDFIEIHKKVWGSRFEIMVGYSDSSKENGVLPSRLMVESALFKIETFLKSINLKPVFFHGSGGSTSRGGGTVQEQISWWPQSALDIFKVTIQGEMVQRNFSNHLIMRSQVGKVIESYAVVKPKEPKHPKTLNIFGESVQAEYRRLVSDPSFHQLTKKATPYQYLNLLRIGSRPTKRQSPEELSLRAIPWILCWTQTRLLLPVWWGTGTAWKKLSKTDKEQLRSYYQSSPLMQTYIKNLGFTFARTELGVWNFHLGSSDLSQDEKNFWREKIVQEYEQSIKFFEEISEEKNLTWFRPWLSESIFFRSSMIHPLNVIQKIALERQDHILLRETVTGIACGMLTTG